MIELAGLPELIRAIQDQTKAITRLAQSNEMLVQAMIESEGLGDQEIQLQTFLDGTSKQI